MKKLLDITVIRLAVILVAALIELVITIALLDYFYTQFTWLEAVLRVLSVLILLLIVRRSQHLSSDMPWILLIMLSPVVGSVFYLLVGANLVSGKTFRNIVAKTHLARKEYVQDTDLMRELELANPIAASQFHYLYDDGGFPVYQNTGMQYYSLGDLGFPHMLEDLKQAENFIFLEYFIIDQGQMWDKILEVLEQKAQAGVDVRVLYDDVGSFGLLPMSYTQVLQEKGIKCVAFNRLNPILNVVVNHRDHRKILVIDGKVAYTGGINLADEYINVRKRYGHWKDNVLRITGEAVWSLTVMFLTTWNALRDEDASFDSFQAEPLLGEADGYISPYCETPLDDKKIGQNVYLNILNQATRYCYIYTPYLIIDTDMRNALKLAASRGVDVRIVCPGVPDKKIIWDISRSHFAQLIEDGVRIFEYDPGFVHSKVFVADDSVAAVGTINLDYRSLYLHFENAVLMYGSSVVNDVRQDFMDTFPLCHEVSVEEARRGLVRELLLTVARVFAPLL